ncbi:MAG: class I SAM-dependent methyltransferase [Deinococcota bacterium]|jgi:SAM-dependent methyltransferase|nr:class I SAM-dependent methyltransferase [Deinococcota bacterium]
MDAFTDRRYLLTSQYKDGSNLNARIELHRRFSTNPYGWTHWVLDQLELPSGSQVLELGCGPATLWRDNLARIPGSWEITLSDFSAGMLAEAQANLGTHRQRFTFEVVDAQVIPRRDAQFDAVIANHMLYHVPDRQKALAEIRRVLKPNGKLYAATNGSKHLLETEVLIRKLKPEQKRMAEPFNLDNGQEQLSACFSNVELRRYNDSLRVTETEPLIAYLLSGLENLSVADERVAALSAYVEREIAEKGAVHITKESGVFVASA